MPAARSTAGLNDREPENRLEPRSTNTITSPMLTVVSSDATRKTDRSLTGCGLASATTTTATRAGHTIEASASTKISASGTGRIVEIRTDAADIYVYILLSLDPAPVPLSLRLHFTADGDARRRPPLRPRARARGAQDERVHDPLAARPRGRADDRLPRRGARDGPDDAVARGRAARRARSRRDTAGRARPAAEGAGPDEHRPFASEARAAALDTGAGRARGPLRSRADRRADDGAPRPRRSGVVIERLI